MKHACRIKMGTEVEHSSADIQTTVTTPPTASRGPKTSMFGKKSGFVIPKNKLSGSLVPVFRGTKKGDADTVKEEAGNQVQRKTKWEPDLAMDTTVRKGRALAYQTRINQISQQLTLGALELDDNEDSLSTSEVQHGKTSDRQLSNEESELLELERREIIGEILKLNPTYKAPPDYKPLLKEAKVPIPMKEHPGYNFVGLVFGPASDTQKRLEKETGAKIRVYGTKADTGGKVEVIPTDGKEIDNAYEDLYVHVSADTFEKVDAAVALIELLVTPVSVNSVSSSTTSAVFDGNVNANLNQGTPSSVVQQPTRITQGTTQPHVGSLPRPGQFPQYPQPWFPAGPTQTPMYPDSGLVAPANTSAPILGNTVQVSSSPFNPTNIPFNPTNMPSLFGQRPMIAASFSPVLQNPSVVPSRPQQPHALQPPFMQQATPLVHIGEPRNPPLPVSQPSTGPTHNVRPVISTPLQFVHLASPISTSASHGLTNLRPRTPPVVPSHGHNPMALQISGVPPMNIPNNMISPLSGASQSGVGVTSQPPRGVFSPLLPSAAPALTIQSSSVIPVQPALPQVGMHGSYPNAIPGPASIPFPVQSSTPLPQPGISNSFTGSGPNFDSRRPLPAGLPRPQQPTSGDFTFQPHRLSNAASQVAWQSNQPAHHNIRPPVQAGQSSLLRPVAHNLNPSPVEGFPRPQMSHQANQPRAQMPTNFSGHPSIRLIPPRHPTLPGQPRSFTLPHPIHNSSGPFPPRPGSQMHIQENHHPGATRPQRVPIPHQHLGNHPGRPFLNSSVAQQVYDPFSPTSASLNPQMDGNATRVHGENDPEYEDLMESVGVK